MSSVLVIQDKHNIYMGSDSAVSVEIEDKLYRLNEEGKKLFIVDNFLLFCSGDLDLSYKIMELFKHDIIRSMTKLQEISEREWSKKYHNTDKFNLDIIVGTYLNGNSVLYQISPYDNFKINTITVNNGEVGIWTGGIKTKETYDMTYKQINNFKLDKLYQNVYDHVSYEGIGGNLTVYKISNSGINVFYKGEIKEKNIRRVNQDNFVKHLVVAERLYGTVVATNDLTIQNESGSFLVNANGATMTNMDITLTTSTVKSRIKMNATEGISIDKNTGTTSVPVWSNQFSVDFNGNALFGGTISIGSGNSVFKADSNGIYLGHNTFASAPFRVTPAGVVTATSLNMTGGTITLGSNFSVTSTGIATMTGANINGNITMTGGSISWSSVTAPNYNQIIGAKPQTYIDSSGIYTGNLHASQIVAGKISAEYIDSNISQVNNTLYLGTFANNNASLVWAGVADIGTRSGFLGVFINTNGGGGLYVDDKKVATEYWVQNNASITAKFA